MDVGDATDRRSTAIPILLALYTSVTDGRTGIRYEDLAYGTFQGFATVGSNNGHNGTTAIDMYHNMDVTTDFAWRSYVGLPL
jgi:hypothetical protein